MQILTAKLFQGIDNEDKEIAEDVKAEDDIDKEVEIEKEIEEIKQLIKVRRIHYDNEINQIKKKREILK